MDAFPKAPITQEHLAKLVAVLLIHRKLLENKSFSAPEDMRTWLVLNQLIMVMEQAALRPVQQGEALVFLTVDDVHLIKQALATQLAMLKKRLSSPQLKQPTLRAEIASEIERLTALQKLINHHFSTTQD